MDKFEAPSLRELIDSGAEKYGNSTFFKYTLNGKTEERSFIQLQQHSKALCRWIRNISAGKLHIAILGKTEYEYIVAFSAAVISGNIAVPFSPDISVTEASDLFKRADIDMLFYEDDFSDITPESRKMIYKESKFDSFIEILKSILNDENFKKNRFISNCYTVMNLMEYILMVSKKKQADIENSILKDRAFKDISQIKLQKKAINENQGDVLKQLYSLITQLFDENKKILINDIDENIKQIFFTRIITNYHE